MNGSPKVRRYTKKELKTTTALLDDKIQSQIINNETGEYLEDIKILNSYINPPAYCWRKRTQDKGYELDNATLNQSKNNS